MQYSPGYTSSVKYPAYKKQSGGEHLVKTFISPFWASNANGRVTKQSRPVLTQPLSKIHPLCQLPTSEGIMQFYCIFLGLQYTTGGKSCQNSSLPCYLSPFRCESISNILEEEHYSQLNLSQCYL